MKTTSIWKATADKQINFPSLQKDITVDVAIIGGGITGLMAALLLSDAGKKVAVFEALSIGLGTTGYSTGNLYSVVDEHLSKIKNKWSKEVMINVVKSRSQALDLIEQTINKFNIDCNFARQPFHYFAEKLDDYSTEFLNEEHNAAQEAGLSASLTSDVPLNFPVERGLRIENQAQFHPLKFVRGLAEKISDKCMIFENTKIEEIDEKNITLKTSSNTIKANKIIIATHTPKGIFAVQSFMGPYREYGVAGTLKSGNYPEGIFWAVSEGKKHSVRSFNDNGKNYILVIGEKHKTGQEDDSINREQMLEKYLKARYDINTFEYRWGGQHYRSADGLAFIGQSFTTDDTYIATGFATDGLVYGTLAAMIIKDHILAKQNEYFDMYNSRRITPMKSAAAFIKENVNEVIQYLKDYPGNTDADEFSEIKKGEGKVIEIEGEKCGAYRDENNQLHVVSAVCTHMKCIVNWNNLEKSWDCPCHGSRFNCKGEVIEGPAISDLPVLNETVVKNNK
jgi:glycine/D-amino acid oxidase-like deaminating enzyme/nitrite reductase/ring-hydroxylating ferredoxin subunit